MTTIYDYDRMNVNRQLTVSVTTGPENSAGCLWQCGHCGPATTMILVRGGWRGNRFDPSRERIIHCCTEHARIWQANHATVETVRCARLGCEAHATRFEEMLQTCGMYTPLCEMHARELLEATP